MFSQRASIVGDHDEQITGIAWGPRIQSPFDQHVLSPGEFQCPHLFQGGVRRDEYI